MEVINEVYPANMEAMQERLASGSEDVVVMVNLLKFKDIAEYAEAEQEAVSGEAAYGKYMAAVNEVLPAIGARIVYEGKTNFIGIGQVEELWDKVLLIEYPSIAALGALGTYESVQAALVHREAGLAGQLLIETTGTD